MTPREIELVQQTFRRVIPTADQTIALFFARLFELDPTLRPLFPGHLPSEGRKLVQIVSLAVDMLGQLGSLLLVIRQLGERAALHGVQDHHYEAVVSAFRWTLRQCLRADYTDEVASAWESCIRVLSGAMRASTVPAHAA